MCRFYKGPKQSYLYFHGGSPSSKHIGRLAFKHKYTDLERGMDIFKESWLTGQAER